MSELAARLAQRDPRQFLTRRTSPPVLRAAVPAAATPLRPDDADADEAYAVRVEDQTLGAGLALGATAAAPQLPITAFFTGAWAPPYDPPLAATHGASAECGGVPHARR